MTRRKTGGYCYIFFLNVACCHIHLKKAPRSRACGFRALFVYMGAFSYQCI
ncbi:membrane protein [Heyndrickxia coagulans]|uniref:Uncharacterized protein n=1 Tax=Heyndrickxia coagulans TaxID=1398 RepID=A0A133K9I0_HEYCO|nr:membrane protein [Heyndrickxia coagulans]KWZ76164.1 hypothetical protein HMPREF3213_03917 [Heyndrickxia coagulans]KXT21390.1 membrane protein [Heyndrickxia coagulans]KYC69513.1 hypothetical protein B4096_3487 [Heyndrickxia coagulans]